MQILQLLREHNEWRKNSINLIASENVMSPLCEKVYISDLMHRYAEGLPFKRHYQGLKFVDQIENITQEEFKKHFNVNFVDVRPNSGTITNFATFASLAERGDNIMTLGIQGGSHISHEKGGAVGVLGLKTTHIPFDTEKMEINVEETGKLILELKPKFIVLGGSVILFPQPIAEIKKYCDQVGTKIVYDAAHVFGLITAKKFQDPIAEGADIITSSTHKTFPGPQGGIVLGNVDEKTAAKIQDRIFPGFLSNHHLHRIPPLYVALQEMKQFGDAYATQIIKNAKALAQELDSLGFDVLAKSKGFTNSHQVLVNVDKQGKGDYVAKTLEKANIILNKNIISTDLTDPENPKGIRIGVQEMTRYGMKEEEMKKIAGFMKEILMDKKDIEMMKNKVIEFRSNFQTIQYCLNEEV